MGTTIGFYFTFGGFPEVMVPRNPTSCSLTFEGSIFSGARSDLAAPTFVMSQVSKSETANMMATPTRVTRRPAGSADDLFS
jgi:hypothetical protein